MIAAPHVKSNLNHADRKVIIDRIVDRLKDSVDEFDAIAISGYSMSLIGSTVAHLLGKNLILVRKSSDVRYSKLEVEGCPNQRYIIIDDMMETGSTIKNVVNKIETLLFDCVCVAVGMYYSRLTSLGREFCQENISSTVRVIDLTERAT